MLPTPPSPKVNPANVPSTPIAVKIPGIAAINLFSVMPLAKLLALKKYAASIVLYNVLFSA